MENIPLQKHRPARFITLEGIEGVGKSTHLKFIQNYLQSRQIPFILTREPGGTPLAETLRELILSKEQEKITPISELLLLFAARAQHIDQLILPALQQGQWVICDRFTESSYAYQGHGRGQATAQIAALERWVQGELQPDLVLLFDAPADIALQRTRKRAKVDRIEAERAEFFERARAGFLQRAREYPQRIKVIDAVQEIAAVQKQIEIELAPFL